MFHHGVTLELNRLKWEVELREKEAKLYADALRTIRTAVTAKAFDQIDFVLNAFNI